MTRKEKDEIFKIAKEIAVTPRGKNQTRKDRVMIIYSALCTIFKNNEKKLYVKTKTLNRKSDKSTRKVPRSKK
jgi:hypothetical protein